MGTVISTTDESSADRVETSRSPADVLRLAIGVVLIVLLGLVGWLFGDALAGFVADLLSGLDAIPDWLIRWSIALVRVVAVVTLIAGVALTVVRNGARMALTVAVAVVVAVLLILILDGVPEIDASPAPVEVREGLGPLTEAGFPSAAIVGAMAAVVSAAAPWLSRRWRRLGWLAVIGLASARFVTAPMTFDAVGAVLIGWTAGTAALVLLGAPTRRPTVDTILTGLARCGLPLATLKVANVDARGSTPYFGAGEGGERYFVKAVGDDERSADLLFRAYRWFHRSDLGDERPFSSLRRAAEHEAFVALAARQLDVLTPRVAAFATAEPNAYVLAYDAVDGRSLDGVAPEELTDEVLGQVWTSLGVLRRARIAHRDLRLANVFLGSDGQVWMIDFGFSEIAASDLLLATDVAELIASSSTVVGPERAVAHAVASVDPTTLAAARSRLKLSALSGATRTSLKSNPGSIEDLQARLASL